MQETKAQILLELEALSAVNSQLNITCQELREQKLDLEKRLAENARWIQEIESVKAVLHTHEQKQGIYHGGLNTAELAQTILAEYKNRAVEIVGGAKAFRDDLMIWLRALAMTLDMTGNAATHREKAARLRGAMEVIEHAISKLRAETFEFSFRNYRWHPFLPSEFPTREFMDRIHELEAQLEDAKQLSDPKPETQNP